VADVLVGTLSMKKMMLAGVIAFSCVPHSQAQIAQGCGDVCRRLCVKELEETYIKIIREFDALAEYIPYDGFPRGQQRSQNALETAAAFRQKLVNVAFTCGLKSN
jgi:hypothetical protein